MSLLGPPAEPPERIFRALMARHPERAIPTRIADHQLTVRAIHPREEWSAIDGCDGGLPELRDSMVQREILSRVLYCGGVRAFVSPDEVGLLSGTLCDALLADVGEALAAIAPTYARSNVDAWVRVLTKGAEHPSNIHDAAVLAGCVDVSLGWGASYTRHRPDQYWGCALGDLLDGHWMVYRAARAAVDKQKG